MESQPPISGPSWFDVDPVQLRKFPSLWVGFLICLLLNLLAGFGFSVLGFLSSNRPKDATTAGAIGYEVGGIAFACIVANVLTLIPFLLLLRGIGLSLNWKPFLAWLISIGIAITSCLCLPPILYGCVIWKIVLDLSRLGVPKGLLFRPTQLREYIDNMEFQKFSRPFSSRIP